MKRIFRIVLTGGPCSGKTSFIAYIRQKLEELGFIVIIVPEAATICIPNGIDPRNPIMGSDIAQFAITSLTIQLENIFGKAAETMLPKLENENIVLIYDRGVPDSKAYTTEDHYNTILEKNGLNFLIARDERYDGVIHMRTAAFGAEKFYTLSNNIARKESIEEARTLDQRTLDAWTGAPHLRVIDNSTGFDEKMRRVQAEVCKILGIPVPIETERKFLVNFDPKKIPSNAQKVNIEQIYLMSANPKEVLRIRKRGQKGFNTFYKTIKIEYGPGENIELENGILEKDYLFGSQFMRPDTAPVRKDRTCFVHCNQYFELDEFEKGQRAIPTNGLLELETTNLQAEIIMPPYLDVVREVTGEKEFSNFSIAKKLCGN